MLRYIGKTVAMRKAPDPVVRKRCSLIKLRLFVCCLVFAAPAQAVSPDDPRGLLPISRPGLVAGPGGGQPACGDIPARPLTVPDLVDIALCNNPQTDIAWAGVRSAAAGVGIARSAELPRLDAAIGPSLNRVDFFGRNALPGSAEVDTSARLALSYLLFDFGGRAASVVAAQAQQRAALAQFADAAQGVALNTVTAYNSLAAYRAAETAAEASVKFARQSRDLAAARQNAGVATGADRLQAETSLAQAQLSLDQARGNTATAAAQLSVTIGLPPMRHLDLAPSPPLPAATLLKDGADALIAQAERLRPDIVAARAGISAADANVRVAQSAGLPSLSLSASNTIGAVDTAFNTNSASVGVSLSVPIFQGFYHRYNVAQARAQADLERASAEQTRQQAGLTVYSSYIALDTAVKALTSARALVASATASADLAQGRYRAGVGTFTDLLNAQSAQAGARQQLVQSEFNLRSANAQLARAVGGIGEAVDAERR